MPVPTANELIRSVIRPSRSGPVANQWTVSLKAHQEEKGAKASLSSSQLSLASSLYPRRTTELRGLLPPPPISQGLRGNHPHHQEENRAKASHLPTISLGESRIDSGMERIDSLWLGAGPLVSGEFRIDSGMVRIDSNALTKLCKTFERTLSRFQDYLSRFLVLKKSCHL
ncbi:hypothetical protein PIB30_082983 [Stylosanthes scabra]|uniref:Uncharacterized protein n=1 Tax=Stylosanthes scabra TaxID=79078 RepID=A0ABU6ZQX6_9FABA|nr:hypothetical protein [Stylosanthes scabra]